MVFMVLSTAMEMMMKGGHLWWAKVEEKKSATTLLALKRSEKFSK